MLDGLWNGWKVGKVFRNPVNWSVEVGRWNANFYRWCMRFLPSTAHFGQIGWARDDVFFMPWGSQFYSVRKTTFKRAFFSKAVISRFILFKRNIEIISPHSCSRFFLGNAWVTKVQGLPPKRWHAHTHTYTYIYIYIMYAPTRSFCEKQISENHRLRFQCRPANFLAQNSDGSRWLQSSQITGALLEKF